MKFTINTCAVILLTTIVLTASVKANEVDRPIDTFSYAARAEKYPPKGKYYSSNYRIEITASGDYLSYDRKGRKLVIFSNYLTTEGKTAEWRYQGYVYRIYEPSSRSDRRPMRFQVYQTVREKTMLMIIDPQGNKTFQEEIYQGQWPVDWEVYGIVN
jgi:hypothetical protein